MTLTTTDPADVTIGRELFHDQDRDAQPVVHLTLPERHDLARLLRGELDLNLYPDVARAYWDTLAAYLEHPGSPA